MEFIPDENGFKPNIKLLTFVSNHDIRPTRINNLFTFNVNLKLFYRLKF